MSGKTCGNCSKFPNCVVLWDALDAKQGELDKAHGLIKRIEKFVEIIGYGNALEKWLAEAYARTQTAEPWGDDEEE